MKKFKLGVKTIRSSAWIVEAERQAEAEKKFAKLCKLGAISYTDAIEDEWTEEFVEEMTR